MKLHPKIEELKKRAAPISYSSTTVDIDGKLSERTSLLDQRIVEGYGCIWGQKNEHQERFFKGAFTRSIQENGPQSGAAYQLKFRDEHGRAMGLFEIVKEDEVGLYFRTKPLDDVSWADDFLTQIRSGTINNFSNGFKYIFDDKSTVWNEKNQSIDIFNARLFEVSGVAIPSDMKTFAMRTMDSEDLYELTEDFIKSLPRKNQLEARRIFAYHKSQQEIEAQSEQAKDLNKRSAVEKNSIDYNYLINSI